MSDPLGADENGGAVDSPPDKPPMKRATKWLIGGGAGLVAILTIGAIGSASDDDKTDETTTLPSTTVPVTVAPTVPPSAALAPAPTAPPQTAPPVSVPGSVSYPNCAAAKAAGAAPLHFGDPGYSTDLDRDGDGIACET